MAQSKHPVISIDDLQPNDSPAGYRATWQEGRLIAYAQLLPLDGDPGRGYVLECNYDTATGREPTDKQIDAGTTLTSNVRELMTGQLVQAGWRMVDTHQAIRKYLWHHTSRPVVSNDAPKQQVHVALDDYALSPYLDGYLRRNYHAEAVQGDVQAIVMFWPWPYAGPHYLLQAGVDRNPFTGEKITPEQEIRAQALLPALLDQVRAALGAAGWSLASRQEQDERHRELWLVPAHFTPSAASAPARSRAQSQAAPATGAIAAVARGGDDQAARPGQRVLSVPARGRVSGYRRTITAHPVTYTCAGCGQETTKEVYPGAAPRYCDTCSSTTRRAKTLARVQRLRAQKQEKAMRQIILDPTGSQIPVTYDDQAGTIAVEGVPVSILEVTDDGISVQARAHIQGTLGSQLAVRRTYDLSGSQFWELVSGQPVVDTNQAGLLEAKRLMTRGISHDQL